MSNHANDTPTVQEMTSAATTVVFRTTLCGSGSSMYNETNEEDNGSGLVIPNIQSEIKIEPPEDINDIGDSNSNYNESASDYSNSPKIRLTPTIKLMPTSKPADTKRRFTCPYDNCTKSYGKSSHLRSHLTWHTGIKPFVCTELNCGKGFTRSDELNRHVRTHTGEKPFECIQCTKKFSRSDHLTKHLATHAKQMQNKSDGPKKSRKEGDMNHVKKGLDSKNIIGEDLRYVKQESYFNEAMRSKPSQEEDITDAKKECYFYNTQYSKTSHEDDETHAKKSYLNGSLDPKTSCESDVSPNDIEHYNFSSGMHFMASVMENCKDPDTVKSSLEKNKEPTTGEYFDHMPIKIKLERPENSDEYHVVKPDTSARKISATMMESQQPVSNTIKRGDTTLGTSSDVVPADGAFMGWPEIGKQKTVYDSHRPWRCASCEKSFKRQDDLNRHLRTHTGEKPFSCVACNRRFMRSDHLKKHLKTHTNPR